MIWSYLLGCFAMLLYAFVSGDPLVLWGAGVWLFPALLWTFLPPPGRKGGLNR